MFDPRDGGSRTQNPHITKELNLGKTKNDKKSKMWQTTDKSAKIAAKTEVI